MTGMKGGRAPIRAPLTTAKTGAVTVKVPGKVMLAGEYTVLDGGAALATTIDRHLSVRVCRGVPGEGLTVGSNLWDAPRLAVKGDVGDEPLLEAVVHGAELFGLTDVAVRVDSELEVTHGVGSSSALRLGTLLALEELAGAKVGDGAKARWATARAAYQLQRQAQRQASGYDIATQLVGGLVRFRGSDLRQAAAATVAWPAEVTRLDAPLQSGMSQLVHIFVGGAGAPTTAVLGSTRDWLASASRAATLTAATEVLLARFIDAFAAPTDAARLSALMAAVGTHRAALAEAPAAPRELAAALAPLAGLDKTWSYKTTGAGGEDALLVVGRLPDLQDVAVTLRRRGWRRLEAGFDTTGTQISNALRAPRVGDSRRPLGDGAKP